MSTNKRVILGRNISVYLNIRHIRFFFFAAKVPIGGWLISSASAGNPQARLPQGRTVEAGGGSASGASLGWSDMTVGEALM